MTWLTRVMESIAKRQSVEIVRHCELSRLVHACSYSRSSRSSASKRLFGSLLFLYRNSFRIINDNMQFAYNTTQFDAGVDNPACSLTGNEPDENKWSDSNQEKASSTAIPNNPRAQGVRGRAPSPIRDLLDPKSPKSLALLQAPRIVNSIKLIQQAYPQKRTKFTSAGSRNDNKMDGVRKVASSRKDPVGFRMAWSRYFWKQGWNCSSVPLWGGIGHFCSKHARKFRGGQYWVVNSFAEFSVSILVLLGFWFLSPISTLAFRASIFCILTVYSTNRMMIWRRWTKRITADRPAQMGLYRYLDISDESTADTFAPRWSHYLYFNNFYLIVWIHNWQVCTFLGVRRRWSTA